MKRGLLTFICFSLTGCSTFLAERVPCPKSVILAEFSKTVEFQNKVPIRTEMDSLSPTCEQRKNQVYIDLRLRVTSLRPLTAFNVPMKLSPSYFVAVVDEEDNILSRTNHDFKVEFEERQTTKVNFLQIQEKVPSGKNVTVYVGFNLDEAQLNFLRKERDKKVHDQRP